MDVHVLSGLCNIITSSTKIHCTANTYFDDFQTMVSIFAWPATLDSKGNKEQFTRKFPSISEVLLVLIRRNE